MTEFPPPGLPGPTAAPSMVPHVSTSVPWSKPRIAGVVAAAAVIIGSLGPWATATVLMATINVSGTNGDGIITLIAGAVAAVMFVLSRRSAVVVFRYVAGGLVVAVSGYDLWNVSNVASDVSNGAVQVSAGWGLYVTFLAGIGVLIATYLARD